MGLFYHEGPLIEEIKDIHGINVISLSKRGRWDIIRFVFRFIKLLKTLQPDILYSFLPDANLVGLISGKIARVRRLCLGGACESVVAGFVFSYSVYRLL